MPASDRKEAFQRYYAKHKDELNARRREKYAMKKLKKVADETSSVPDETSSVPDEILPLHNAETPTILIESVQWFQEMSRRVWKASLEKRYEQEFDKGICQLNNRCCETVDPEPLKYVDRITTWSY